MSSKHLGQNEKEKFVSRFVEACGSDQPGKVAQLLNVSYQAARNYLDGRLPDAKVLRSIAENTPYSINWLLTGEGEKFAVNSARPAESLMNDSMREAVRQVCLEVFADILRSVEQSIEPKVVKLTADKIKEETFRLENAAVSESDR